LLRHITVISYIHNFTQHSSVKIDSTCRRNYWDHHCGFTITDQLLICIHHTLEKKMEYNGAVNQLFIYLKTAYNSMFV